MLQRLSLLHPTLVVNQSDFYQTLKELSVSRLIYVRHVEGINYNGSKSLLRTYEINHVAELPTFEELAMPATQDFETYGTDSILEPLDTKNRDYLLLPEHEGEIFSGAKLPHSNVEVPTGTEEYDWVAKEGLLVKRYTNKQKI